MSRNLRIIVVGIDTNVGKTVTSAILTEALQGYYWKPVQCGPLKDRDWVADKLSLKERCYPEAFCLHSPCSPHLAAEKEGLSITAQELIPPLCSAPLIIEGTGGLLCPLNSHETWVDAAASWRGLYVLVHRHYLGSFNHFFLTLEAMQRRNLPLLGIVFNGLSDAQTEAMLLKKANTICLGRLLWEPQLTPQIVQHLAKQWKETWG
ncbi:MAG: dethiobiotin synthase [Verrucomicrobia bacterium]|nr:dethiobiotin synthase [Verrucomicrobiota bacterium]